MFVVTALVQTVRIESQRLAQAPMELVRARQAAFVKVSAARVGEVMRQRRRKVGRRHDCADVRHCDECERGGGVFAMSNIT